MSILKSAADEAKVSEKGVGGSEFSIGEVGGSNTLRSTVSDTPYDVPFNGKSDAGIPLVTIVSVEEGSAPTKGADQEFKG